MCNEIAFLAALVEENGFVIEGRMVILAVAEKTFCPGLGQEGVMSLEGSYFWPSVRGTGRVCVGKG